VFYGYCVFGDFFDIITASQIAQSSQYFLHTKTDKHTGKITLWLSHRPTLKRTEHAAIHPNNLMHIMESCIRLINAVHQVQCSLQACNLVHRRSAAAAQVAIW